MSKLLNIQASPRGKRSKSIIVADAFVETYKRRHPDDEIVTLNVFREPIPDFDGLAVEAKYKLLDGKELSQEELREWKKVEEVIEQFTSADKYLLAVAMWNFSIPYRLKQYIDVLVQPGYTFSYSEDKGYQGLVAGKPMVVVYARGGEYALGSEAEAFDLQKKYIELIFTFMGIKNMRSVIVEPTLQGGPDVAAKKCEEAIENAREIASSF